MFDFKKRNEIIQTMHDDKSPENLQNVHTPYNIVDEMIELVPTDDYDYVVLFAPEFVERLIFKYNIPSDKITFIADTDKENYIVQNLYNVNTVTFFYSKDVHNGSEDVMPKSNKLVIFGNPPYQEMTSRKNLAVPIYNKFVDACIAMSPRYISMIIPSKWMQGGLGLSDFRNKMKADNHLKMIKHFNKEREVFKGVDLLGGVNYFLWDKNHYGLCDFNGQQQDLNKYDIIITDNNAHEIIDKLDISKNLGQIVYSVCPFKNIKSNFNEWDIAGTKCYVRGRKINHINPSKVIDANNIIHKWKVAISCAVGYPGEDRNGEISPISYAFIIEPGAICTATYLILNSFDSKQEADNFISFIKTKTFRFLLSLRVPTQHISKDSFGFVPDLQDYSHTWDDKQVCEKFGITDDEFQYIDSKIRGWREVAAAEEEAEEVDTEETEADEEE